MSHRAISSICQLAVVLYCAFAATNSGASVFWIDLPEGIQDYKWVAILAVGSSTLFYSILPIFMFVTPHKTFAFFAPKWLEGGALYLSAALRVVTSINLIDSISFTFCLYSMNYRPTGSEILSKFSVIALAPTIVDLVFIVLAPWIARFVIGQVRTGVMWYSVIVAKMRMGSAPKDI